LKFRDILEIPLKEPTSSNPEDNKAKIITSVVLGSLADVGGAAGGTIFYKRKSKRKTNSS